MLGSSYRFLLDGLIEELLQIVVQSLKVSLFFGTNDRLSALILGGQHFREFWNGRCRRLIGGMKENLQTQDEKADRGRSHGVSRRLAGERSSRAVAIVTKARASEIAPDRR